MSHISWLVSSHLTKILLFYDAGVASDGNGWIRKLLVLFVIFVCFVALVQCFIGSDVLRWRSFYATQDDVWKAHYHEVFDYTIREIMCCFGRVEYL